MKLYLISLMILLPFLGALLQLFLHGASDRRFTILGKWLALGLSSLSGLIGVVLVFSVKGVGEAASSVSQLSWIGSYAISYSVGLDGFNSVVLVLISVVFPLLIIFEWEQKQSPRGLFALILILQAALTGVVCSQDLFLLFFFWAITPLPIFFMISVWGDKEKEKAAFYYVMSSFVGNALLLISLILVYYSVSPYTFSLAELSKEGVGQSSISILGIDVAVPRLAFLFLTLGLALRVPVVPLHGWLSYAATQMSASVMILLTGVFAPVGLYIFVKLGFSLFPQELQNYQNLLIGLGLINMIYASLSVVVQREFRQFLAFFCLAQVGILLMGIASREEEGVVGAIYQQLTLGLGISGLGMLAGLLFGRTGEFAFIKSDGAPHFGGLVRRTPILALVTALLTLSVLGLPGMGGFIGQSLVVMGSYTIDPSMLLMVGLSVVILTYGMFYLYRNVFLGESSGSNEVADLSFREKGFLFPIVLALLVLGVHPRPLISLIRPTVVELLGVGG